MEFKFGTGCATFEGNKIFLTRRSSTKQPFPDLWCTPGGKPKPGDLTLEDTIVRRFFEETGKTLELTGRLNFYQTQIDENTTIVGHIYVGKASGELNLDPNEICEAGYFTYEEAKKLDFAFQYRKVIEDLHEKGHF